MEKELIKVIVPQDRIARVIGKAGGSLKQLRETTGAKIQVQPRDDDRSEDTREVELSGHVDQVAASFGQLVGKAFSDEDSATISFLVPAEKAGIVVGKGGENLKKVRHEYFIKVQMERSPVSQDGVQFRQVSMQGEVQNMGSALRLVLGAPRFFQAFGGTLQGQAPGLLGASSGVCLSDVRPASENPNEIQLHMEVHERFAGVILGKGGETVKQTAISSGCKAFMTGRDNRNGERRVVLIGTYDQCAVAQKMIHQQCINYVEEANPGEKSDIGEVVVFFLIRREAAGSVIGKQGASVKYVREESGSRIQITHEEVCGHRPCRITGSLQAVLQAELLISEVVNKIPVEPASAPPGMNGFGYRGYELGTSMASRGRGDEDMTKLLIPAECAGSVIGKQGSGLKQIREKCNVSVDMLQVAQAPQWPADRIVTVKGNLAARMSAVEAILRLAFRTQQANVEPCLLKVLIASSAAGSLIGKQGSILRTIREKSGTSITVDREAVLGERLVTASGSLQQVVAAASSILQVLEHASQYPEQDQSGYQGQVQTPSALASHEPFHIGARYMTGPQWY